MKREYQNKHKFLIKQIFEEFSPKHKKIDMNKDLDGANDFWLIVLFIFYMYLDRDTQKLWDDFSIEVKTNNRFFPESNLLKKLSDVADKATCIISKGTVLYRARDYLKYDLLKNDMVVSMIEIIKDEYPGLEFDEADIFSEAAINLAIIPLFSDGEKVKRIYEKITRLSQRDTCFWGYDKCNSDAPPSECAKEGRANPQGISYLYSSEDIKTAILEMRPQLQKMYNIATIEITKDAKLFDFTYSTDKLDTDEQTVLVDLHRISEEFSKPNFGNPIEYVPTQFVCEYIKKLGFDGIKFRSAVSTTGTNVLLFDVNEESRVYDVKGSKVYEVNALDIDVIQIIPMEK